MQPHLAAALADWVEPIGEGPVQLLELLFALVLCSLIGLERQLRQKSAGLRTHTLVGLGSALFMLISKYGFTDVLASERVVLDPSRVAAQIVSGIGFIGGGLIFVRRDVVRGLTTAAVVWAAAGPGRHRGAFPRSLRLSAAGPQDRPHHGRGDQHPADLSGRARRAARCARRGHQTRLLRA